MEDSEGTVRQIGAFSEGIQNLTVRISRFKNSSVVQRSISRGVNLSLFASSTRACWKMMNSLKRFQTRQTPAWPTKTPMHKTVSISDLVLLWMKLCANPLHSHTDESQQTLTMFPCFLFSVTFKEPKVLQCLLLSLCCKSLHSRQYRHLMPEGTFRTTPLFACQLVSGNFLVQRKCQPAGKTTSEKLPI